MRCDSVKSWLAWLLVQLMKRWEVTNVGSSVAKRVDLKNPHYTQKNLVTIYGDGC